ncbi:MAG: hypothetical protein KKA52_06300 [Candidatus Omnitrophica bacterium]|nr:hypothetical protein [Candidatus Omnitrophota bacterium]
MSSNGKNIIVLIEEFRGSPEYALYKSLTTFNISLYIFNTNYSHLKKILEFVMDDPKFAPLMDVRNRDQLNNLLDDVIRLLHNFVAAAISLVDHTRNVYKELYSQTAKFPDYQNHIDREFKDDPLVQFVHCLRQYCQHYRAPNISIQHSWNKNDEKIKNTVNLLKKDLEIFGSWNANARKYLDQIEERLDIYELITTYRKRILDFQVWFNSRQKEIHKTEFDLLQKKEEELLKAQLNHFLDMALSSKEKSKVGEVDIFYGIFNSRDYKELNGIPMDSTKRCARAIELVQGYIPISDDIIKKITEWYKKQI